MANNSVILSTLDFDSLKSNLKQYLQTQSVFKDYNFEASNINVLLDVLSHNSYLNSFYLNMIASEMFLDSAQKYDSVVSHAKELNYIPRSNRSSTGIINLKIESENLGGQLTIPKGTIFTGVNANGSFNFTTNESRTISSPNNTYYANNLQIFEGLYFNDSYVMNYDLETQQFLISNEDVDINSVSVTVIENSGANTSEFKRTESLFGLDSSSEVFFIQPSFNNLYEVEFGDGLFGRKPLNGAVINIQYRTSSGADADGVSRFSLSTDLGPVNNANILRSNTSIVSSSYGGSDKEGIESIRFSAPRYFATQQRAVTTDDYASLITSNFSNDVDDVSVFGGQDLEVKRYGTTVVCLKPFNSGSVPSYVKTEISNYLKDYIAIPNKVLITDPEYIYCSVFSEVQYSSKTTTKSASDISSLVLNSIRNYSKDNLEKFDDDFRFSRLLTAIDNSDPSITSNYTEVRMIRKINPIINTPATFSLDYGNSIYYDSTSSVQSEIHKQLHETEKELLTEHSSLISSNFTYVDKAGVAHPLSFLEDRDGVVNVYKFTSEDIVLLGSAGTIDYANGRVILNDFTVSDYEGSISVIARPIERDIIASKDKIIIIDPNDVNISVVETRF